MVNIIKKSAILLLSAITCNSFAQVCHNLYPYAAGAVYDNNGHDLYGFLKRNKADALYKSGKINELSGGTWGYVQIKNARVPSINVIPGKDKRVTLSYSEFIDATLAIYKTSDGPKATWWARQCNNPTGPLFWKKVDDEGKLDVSPVRYTELSRDMDLKKFTVVEYNDSVYNQRDYDQLLKNYILVERDIVKDANDYKGIIEYYNNFLGKFSYTDDPVLMDKSFITFLSGNGARYIGYFNIVNGKLAGHLELADIQYESDKEVLVNRIAKKLTGKTIYVYGDDIFGLEKTFLKYKHSHHDIQIIRRTTDANETFNKS
jgi:hypothetical protein